jgi:type VI protein secretion system component VasF
MESEKLRQDRIDAWAAVRAVFAAATELMREAKRQVAGQASENEAAEAARAPKGPPASYIRRRQDLRNGLVVTCKALLGKYLGEHQASHCLLPLVIAFDERERLALGALAKKWSLPRLQVELLEIDDGGDRFYDQLDQHLESSGVHPLVFELFLLCLKDGFEGRYQGRESERQGFIGRVTERIRREDPRRAMASTPGTSLVRTEPGADERAAGGEQRRRKVTFVAFPYRYYVAAAGLALLVFVGLRIHSLRVVTSSPIGCACSASAQENPGQCMGADGH